MKKQTHFRIIELATHQVLLTKDFDEDEENTPLMTVTIFKDNCRAEVKMGFDTEEKRDEVFNEFTIESAEKLLKNVLDNF